MKLHYVLTAALLAASPAIAKPAPRPASAAKVNPASLKAVCERLALLVTPESAVPGQVDGIVGSLLQTMVANDSGFAALNAKYPGMTDAIAVRVKPLMLESSRVTMPLYRAELAQFYADNMTLAEAQAAVAFFGSADGQDMLSSANAQLDYKATGAVMGKGGEAGSAELRQDARSAAARAVEAMPAQRRARIGAFFASPAGQKIIAIGARKAELDRKWFNYSPPGMEDRVARATVEAMLDHIGKTDPDMAKRMRDGLIAKGVLPKA